MQILLKDLQATRDFANSLAAVILSDMHVIARSETTKQSPCASWVILLDGEMGSGKTTFTREFGTALGIKEKITSPTFVGMHEYHTESLGFYHFDMYQVGIGLEDLAEIVESDLPKVLVFEWSERLSAEQRKILSGLNILEIKLSAINDNERLIEVSPHPLLSKLDLQSQET